MKKFQLLGVAVVAMLAVGVFSAASASAAVTTLLAEWLVGGTAVTEGQSLNTETVGTLLLEDTKTPLGASDIICSGKLLGTIGFDGLDVVSEVLSLTGTAISKVGLSGEALSCETVSVCEEALVWAINLPWNTLLKLIEDGTEKFFGDYIESSGAGNPGWEVECMKTILKPVDECTAVLGVTKLTLDGPLLLGGFSEAFTELAGLKLANCSLGGTEAGIVETESSGEVLVEGGTLGASSESEEA